MSKITTHVLDTVLGKPAAGVAIRLEAQRNGVWVEIARAATGGDGRCRDLASDLPEGIYRLTFFIGEYMGRAGRKSMYPEIGVTFTCGAEPHYHLPLLISDNSYTTYRGS